MKTTTFSVTIPTEMRNDFHNMMLSALYEYQVNRGAHADHINALLDLSNVEECVDGMRWDAEQYVAKRYATMDDNFKARKLPMVQRALYLAKLVRQAVFNSSYVDNE